MENFTQYVTVYMNSDLGTVDTESESRKEWAALYDGGDETNPIPFSDFYEEITHEVPVTITVDENVRPHGRISAKFKDFHGNIVEIWMTCVSHSRTDKNGLMNLWIKHGYMDHFIPETIAVDVFVTEESGDCYCKYNPQIRESDHRINFRWMLEWNDYNAEMIITATIRNAYR